jgi:hypothetical protein
VSPALVVVQLLNGVQLGLMLFLMASGLTLVFGVMDFINLAHGSFYMIGAFIASSVLAWTGNFVLSLVVATAGAGIVGLLLELGMLRKVYQQSHLQHVLITFGLILVFNELARLIWGPFPVPLPVPSFLAGTVEILPGVTYPTFRLAILLVGLAVAVALYVVISHTRAGMWVRAGASDYLGEQIDLLEFIGERRERLVLKPNDDYGGHGISIGWNTDEISWDEAIHHALANGDYLVQERVPTAREVFPALTASGTIAFAEQLVDLDPLLFNGKVGSAFTRLSSNELANVTSGGGMVPTFIISKR